MKKITIISLLSLCAAGAYAQGTLLFNDFQSEGYSSEIYSPNTANPAVETQGNTSAQNPIGTQSYANSVPIGGQRGGGVMNYAYGNQFTVQLYWTPNTYIASWYATTSSHFNTVMTAIKTPVAAFSGLNGDETADIGEGLGNPSPSYVGTMSDGTQTQPAGYFQITSVDNGLFGDTATQSDWINLSQQDVNASVAVACWYNNGGLIQSLAAASAAQVPYGISLPFLLTGLGEDSADNTVFKNGSATPGSLAPAMNQLTSFSLIGGTVPEPSTIALGVLGACAFLARRRK
jgi:hypothetical protein